MGEFSTRSNNGLKKEGQYVEAMDLTFILVLTTDHTDDTDSKIIRLLVSIAVLRA